ncbi:hypothetical protein D3C81_1878820 [compost metagenome]
MIGKGFDARLKRRGNLANVLDDIQFVIHAQCFQRHSGGHRMPAIGVTVTEAAERVALIGDDLIDLVAEQ